MPASATAVHPHRSIRVPGHPHRLTSTSPASTQRKDEAQNNSDRKAAENKCRASARLLKQGAPRKHTLPPHLHRFTARTLFCDPFSHVPDRTFALFAVWPTSCSGLVSEELEKTVWFRGGRIGHLLGYTTVATLLTSVLVICYSINMRIYNIHTPIEG